MSKRQQNICIGIVAAECGFQRASSVFNVSNFKAKYWCTNVLSNTLSHHGGKRWSKFAPNEMIQIERLIFEHVESCQFLVTRKSVVQFLQTHGYIVNEMFITRIFKRFGIFFI